MLHLMSLITSDCGVGWRTCTDVLAVRMHVFRASTHNRDSLLVILARGTEETGILSLHKSVGDV